MRFLFVDRIFEYEPWKYIRGLKNVTRNEGFYYWLPNGQRVLSPAVVTEALAQLGGWLQMVSSGFEKRPVLLADERTEYLDLVFPGDQIDLSVDVISYDEDVVVTKGVARVRGRDVIIGHCCRGYLLPLTDFSDPDLTKRAFQGIYKPEFKGVSRLDSDGTSLKAIAGHQTFESLRYIDGLIKHEPYKSVTSFKNITNAEPYFQEHFPRKPCVPGVILLTFVGETCQYLVKENIDFPVRQRALIPTYIQNVRFRKFVEPGDQCIVKAEVIKGDLHGNNSEALIKTVILANDNRVMQAEMGFRTMFL